MHRIWRSLRVTGGLIGSFFRSPTPYLVFVTVAILLWDECFYMGRMARSYGFAVHAGGVFAAVMNDGLTLAALSFGLVFLLGDAPFLRENAMFEWMRSDRLSWTVGRVLYVLAVVLMYLLAIQALVCVEAWSVNFGPKWDKVLRTLGTGRHLSDISLSVSSSLLSSRRPMQAWLYTFGMMGLAWSSLGFILFSLSVLTRRLFAMLVVSVVVFMDYLVESMMPYRMYFYSVLSWAKLSVVGGRANPYMPGTDFAVPALLLAFAGLVILSVAAGICKKRILDKQFQL